MFSFRLNSKLIEFNRIGGLKNQKLSLSGMKHMGKYGVSELYSMWLKSLDTGIHLYKLKCDERKNLNPNCCSFFSKS